MLIAAEWVGGLRGLLPIVGPLLMAAS